ncbi:MAG: carboxypeptidase [Bacteroidetes bacterium]|nr:carboxypeptidase [Bacteroidota bacterium]
MTQLISPEKLSHRSKVLIVSPSGAIEPAYIDDVCLVLKNWGLFPEVMPYAKNRLGRFCGTMEERLSDLQQAMDDPEAKAILCSRGGYGIAHLLDKLDFSGIKKYPKWLIGYSDITALHAAFFKNGLMSLHAPMAKHLVQDMDSIASYYLKEMLFGAPVHYEVAPNRLNRAGKVSGKLMGGNLTVACNLLGTPYLEIPEGTILFVEDIAEKPYQIDRMMWHLKLAGVFDRISGLVVGRFTEYQEDPLMYFSVYESIRDLVSDYDFPLCFDFPVGHVVGNYPLVHGAETVFEVTQFKASLDQHRKGAFF